MSPSDQDASFGEEIEPTQACKKSHVNDNGGLLSHGLPLLLYKFVSLIWFLPNSQNLLKSPVTDLVEGAGKVTIKDGKPWG